MKAPFSHDDVMHRESSAILQTYRRLPIVIDRAEECRVFDVDGTSYLDMLGGIAVNALGHSNKRIIDAVVDQVQRYMHVSNNYYIEPQVKLAEMLKEASGFDKVYFCNSGTEAVESAIKLARKFTSKDGRYDVVGFTGGFHGRTYGSLSIMDKPLYKDGMGPFLPNTLVLPYNDVDALESRVGPETCAVVLEFVQGEGGLAEASQEFVDALFRLKAEHNFVVIADEVQTGIGRTGSFFAFERYGIRPDVVCIAKAIGGGLPLGGLLVDKGLGSVWGKGMHGSTYGGNPVACVAGAVVVEEVLGGLMQHVASVGEYARQQLESVKNQFPSIVRAVRGRGCMFGLLLSIEALKVVDALVAQHVLCNAAGPNVVRFVPPYIITNAEVDVLVAALNKVLM